MKLGFKRGEKGFTLVEIIIVLAVIGVLAAVVIPNLTGFLGRGKERSWNADQSILQAAVDAYRTDISNRTGNPWPTLGNLTGIPTDSSDNSTDTPDGDYTDFGDMDRLYEPGADPEEGEDLNSFIDIGALAAAGYLKGTDAVKSADTRLNTTANNSPSGSYGWYINSTGVVDAICWVDADNNGKVPTANVTDEVNQSGYVTDVYP